MTGRGRRGATSAVLALALVLAACSDGGSDRASPTSTSTSTTRPADASSTTSSSTTAPPPTSSTTTGPPPPGPLPVEQLAGLRPYAAGEGCRLLLANLEAPTFPAWLRDRFATGYSGFVSSAGIVDVTASSGVDDTDFDYYGFVSPSWGSEVDQGRYFDFVSQVQPATSADMHTVSFTRRADGSFACRELAAEGGG